MSATPTERRLAAQIAAHSHGPRRRGSKRTAAGRTAFLDRFERQVDPDGTLDPRSAPAVPSTQSAHTQRLALKSAREPAPRP